jgi:transposase
MLYVGLDLSRKRLDWQALLPDGERAALGAVPPDRDGLGKLVQRLGDADEIVAVIESMSGARFVHDELELQGWDVRIADALKARGIAPLACKTDTIDTWLLAELARLELVPEIWLPDPEVRAERERARFRLHLVKHRSALKNRIHAILFQHGIPSEGSDLFGAGGRALLERLSLPEPWASTVAASLELIDVLDGQIAACERELRRLGAEHRYVPLAPHLPGDRLGARLHDRLRDRRHRSLPGAEQAGRLQRPLPAGRAVGRARPARPLAQERAQPPALGARRGGAHRLPPSALPAAARAQARPAGPKAGDEDRGHRGRAQTDRGDLAHADP